MIIIEGGASMQQGNKLHLKQWTNGENIQLWSFCKRWKKGYLNSLMQRITEENRIHIHIQATYACHEISHNSEVRWQIQPIPQIYSSGTRVVLELMLILLCRHFKQQVKLFQQILEICGKDCFVVMTLKTILKKAAS